MNKKINTAMSDAFGETESGKFFVVEAKSTSDMQMKELNTLSHNTFVEMTQSSYYRSWFYVTMNDRKVAGKKTLNTPFDLFKASKPILKKIASGKGEEFRSTLLTLQYTWDSIGNLANTVDLILGK